LQDLLHIISFYKKEYDYTHIYALLKQQYDILSHISAILLQFIW